MIEDFDKSPSEWIDAIHWAKNLISEYEKNSGKTSLNFESLKPEEKYQVITEYSNDIICLLDNKTLKIDYINKTILNHSGYTKEEIIGQKSPKSIGASTSMGR